MPFQRKAGRFNRSQRTNRLPQKDYTSLQTSSRRHEYVSQDFNGNLSPDRCVAIDMLKFARTFDPLNPDVLPTPTASNNYQTARVMNGSKIINHSAKIQIKNPVASNSGTGTPKEISFDVYQVALSFFDANNWEDFDSVTGTTLIQFDGSTASDEAGQVDWVGLSNTFDLFENSIKNFKMTQHYLKKLGTVDIPFGSVAQLNFGLPPPKCRRSNSGMFWGILLHNNSQKNQSNAVAVNVASEHSFEEIPSEVRLPFVY